MSQELNLPLGLALKDQGIEKVAQNNEAWLEKVRQYAKVVSANRGGVTSDDLRDPVARALVGISPTHPNAWGAIFQGPEWKVVGRTKSKIASNHGREIRIWRWVGA